MRAEPRPALDEPAIRALLLATLLSGLGSAVSILAIPWVIYAETRIASLIAVYFIVAQVGAILVLPWFGSLVDTYAPKRVSIGVQLAGCATQLGAAALWLATGDALLLAATAALSLTTRSLDQVARQSLIHGMAESGGYVVVNRRFEIVRQVVTFGSGFVAIPIYGIGGIALVLVLDAASYALAAACIARLPRAETRAGAAAAPRTFASRMRDSALLLRRHRTMALTLLASALPSAGVVAMSTIMPRHFESFLATGPEAYYLHDSVYAAGALLLAFLWRRSVAPAKARLLFASLLAAAAALVVVLALVPHLGATYLAIAGLAAVSASLRIVRTTLVMEIFASDEQGRAHGYVEIVVTACMLALVLLSGLASDFVGLTAAWFCFALAYVGGLLLLFSLGARGPRVGHAPPETTA